MNEKFDEVKNLKRVGGLERDKPGLWFGDTLKSGRKNVSYGLR
jgi:hypothetical protein